MRLEESAAAVEGYYAQWHDELEVRDAIIIEALEKRIPHSQVAQRGRLSAPRINQIVARRWPR